MPTFSLLLQVGVVPVRLTAAATADPVIRHVAHLFSGVAKEKEASASAPAGAIAPGGADAGAPVPVGVSPGDDSGVTDSSGGGAGTGAGAGAVSSTGASKGDVTDGDGELPLDALAEDGGYGGLVPSADHIDVPELPGRAAVGEGAGAFRSHHGDTFSLPSTATLLASSDMYQQVALATTM
jgi:hypothetical protein